MSDLDRDRVLFFVFRHGETEYNREGRFQGHLDIPLNENGVAQAKKLESVVKKLNLDFAVSSDLSRAYETAQLSALNKFKILKHSALREAHLGEAQGYTHSELIEKFGAHVIERWRSPFLSDADVSYPGGEKGSEVLNRVLVALGEISQYEKHAKRIGIFTHGGVIRRLAQASLGLEHSLVPIPNGIVYGFEWDKRKCTELKSNLKLMNYFLL